MTDRPIIMSAPMVRALLAGNKTETRRLAWKLHPPTDDNRILSAEIVPTGYQWRQGVLVKPTIWQKARPGDRLWVRETWGTDDSAQDDCPPRQLASFDSVGLLYRATDKCNFTKWRPSIHMPRWASRLTLVVTEARMERLQEISEAGAKAEGCEPLVNDKMGTTEPGFEYRVGYARLWNSLHGPGAWEANPEVCAISFSVHQANIDSMERAA